ncbi:MAG: hypothetical protein JW768_13115 [Chitinispirillaceae bacterium]|nr:hypothetical protein [Chitinispirillaceae bacterium]
MKHYAVYLYASILALIISCVFGFGITSRHGDFTRTVEKALSTSVGYDQAFIRMVDRLERELAQRASFGYEGGKDPMTGMVRQVVVQKPPEQGPIKKKDSTAADTVPVDPFRLTAIIYDNDDKTFTAVIMEKERTFSVSVGDKVGKRVIKGITMDGLIMEEDSLVFRYGVTGTKSITKK